MKFVRSSLSKLKLPENMNIAAVSLGVIWAVFAGFTLLAYIYTTPEQFAPVVDYFKLLSAFLVGVLCSSIRRF